MTQKPYTKTLQDELDWKLLDQLHSVVAQISGFCFDTKKFCVTTEFVVLTLIVKFTIGLRLSDESESLGVDESEHAETAYDFAALGGNSAAARVSGKEG